MVSLRPLLLSLLVLSAVLAGCVSDPQDEVPAPAGVEDPPNGRWSRVAPDTYSVYPGDYRFDGALGGSLPLVDGPFAVQPVEREVFASELDGADIDLSYWLPDVPEGEKVPVIVQASPYFPRTDVPSGSQDFGHWMVDVFVPHGYAYVQLAIRSTADSGGCDDFRGPNMVADMDQAIDLLAAKEWSNGNVALIGKSYPGSTPWYAAGTANPAIKTIVPVSGSTNAWEVYNRNGTPESRAAIIVPNYGASAASNMERDPEHKVENFACAEVWEGWAYGVSSGASGERLPPEWWQERNAKPAVEANYRGSILLVHGLEDWNVDPAVAIPWTDQLNASGLHVKQFLGQWAHDHPDQGSDNTKRWDWAQLLLNWFDRWLKEDETVDTGPPVQVQSNDGRWRDELHWPPRDADWQVLHLADGMLTNESGPAGSFLVTPGGMTGVHSETDEAGTRTLFRLGPLDHDLHVAGLPKVHVTVTPTGASGFVGALLYDESPDGALERIGWTGMNLRYADGGEAPQTVVPGEKLLAKLQIQPMDAVVPAGHTLVLEVGSDLPSDRIPPPHPSPVLLHWGDGASVLKLPVVDRDPSAFFEPPHPEA